MVRTAQEFVEDLLSDGKDADYIMLIASNTRWKHQLEEVVREIKSFSGKFKKRFTESGRFPR